MAYTFKHGDRPLDGITIQRAVGRGGFGEVYYALTDSGKQVAVKYLRDNPEVELRGIAHVLNLKSPHLIAVYDVKQSREGEPFVIMEYIGGPSLRDLLLAEPKGLGPQKAAYILCGIAQGLAYLHERGIVHRDLKPGNIFYDDGYVKIGDYGLSKHISVSQHSGQTVSVGTVHYMAPEIGSGSYSKAIDIYALGVILFEMLTGGLPFTGSSMGEILMRHLSERPDLSRVPAPFVEIIRIALAKDPTERYQSVADMVAAIKGSADVSASMASFDASVFSQVPRIAASDDPTRTGVTPHRGGPALDVRDAAVLGGLEARLGQRGAELEARLAERTEKLAGKAAKKARKAGLPEPPGVPVTAAELRGKSRLLHALVLVAGAVATSMLVGLLAIRRDGVEATLALSMLLVALSSSALFTHLICLPRILMRNAFIDRVAFGSMAALLGGVPLAIGFEVDRELGRMMLAPFAALLLLDWNRRIEAGRRGKVTLSEAFWPAIVGLFVAGIADADELVPAGGAICAVMALLIQAAAAMWPVAPVRSAQRSRPPGAVELPQAAPMPVAAALAVGPAAMPTGPYAASERAADPDSSPESPARTERPLLDPDAPSFVGRAANAGISFLAKLLMLSGLALAVLYNSLSLKIHDYPVDHIVAMRNGELIIDDGREPERYYIPRVLPLVPIVVGSLLLLLSRRRDGGWHFLRGFIGCIFVGAAGVVALVPAAESLRIFLSQHDWSPLGNESMLMPLVVLGVLLGWGLGLILWPRRRPRRRPYPAREL